MRFQPAQPDEPAGQVRRLPEDDYLNRLSSVCGAWFASDNACVPSC